VTMALVNPFAAATPAAANPFAAGAAANPFATPAAAAPANPFQTPAPSTAPVRAAAACRSSVASQAPLTLPLPSLNAVLVMCCLVVSRSHHALCVCVVCVRVCVCVACTTFHHPSLLLLRPPPLPPPRHPSEPLPRPTHLVPPQRLRLQPTLLRRPARQPTCSRARPLHLRPPQQAAEERATRPLKPPRCVWLGWVGLGWRVVRLVLTRACLVAFCFVFCSNSLASAVVFVVVVVVVVVACAMCLLCRCASSVSACPHCPHAHEP